MTETAATRAAVRELQRVAVHVVARARQQATGRFSLRVVPGGFGTPELGPDARRVRVSGALLVVESDAADASSTAVRGIDGSSLRELAELAGVDVSRPLDVGHDTPALGDLDAAIALDEAAAALIAEWYRIGAAALDNLCAGVPDAATPSLIRLWPEHFDVALDLAATPSVRANFGASPGDDSSEEPYVYVAPWTADRPGDPAFWNAPFGAARGRSQLAGDPVVAATAFFLDGCRRLALTGAGDR